MKVIKSEENYSLSSSEGKAGSTTFGALKDATGDNWNPSALNVSPIKSAKASSLSSPLIF